MQSAAQWTDRPVLDTVPAPCITVSDDRMTATLTKWSDRPLRPRAILDALRAAGVTAGMRPGLFDRVLAAAVGEPVVVAEGRPPGDPVPGRAETLVEIPACGPAKPPLDGCAGCTGLTLVKVGQPLMRRIPGVRGRVGVDVCGTLLLPQLPLSPVWPPAGPGTALVDGDEDMLAATAAGVLRWTRSGPWVERVRMVLPETCGETPVSFDGTLIVVGTVTARMRLTSAGDIHVRGGVDGGAMTAGGNILVHGLVADLAWGQMQAGGYMLCDG